MATTQKMYLGGIEVTKNYFGDNQIVSLYQEPVLDENVQNFVNATGITNDSIITPLNTFVNTLKSDGIWTKLYALYPFVGGTEQTNKYNLINTGSYLLAFTGSWAYNDNGVSSNGTNTYANTSFNPTSSVSDYVKNSSLSVYTRTNTTSSGYDMGSESAVDIGERRTYFISKGGGNKAQYDIGLNQLISAADVTGSGFFTATVSGSSTNNQRIFRNGTSIANQTNNITECSRVSIYLAANNFRGVSVNAYTSESYSLASIGKGLTDSEAATYNTAVQTFQTSLNRQV
jgi:hypothetical protein